ncbi:MAG: class B sortase [Clostridia bacterium]|nr:class B sortase [Clostridia bacterium]
MADNNKTIPSKQEREEKTLFEILNSMQADPTPAVSTEEGELVPLLLDTDGSGEYDTMPELPIDDLELLLIPAYDDEEEVEELPRVPRRVARLREEEGEEELPTPPTRLRNPFVVLWDAFSVNLPRKGDTGAALARKCGFLLSLLVMLVSVGYLVADLWLRPMQNDQLKAELENLYQPENSMIVADGNNTYPSGMLASFKELYNRNDEVRGWLSFHATGKTDFLNIDYPVLYSGDNEKYLTLDFDEKKNKNGALFFDENNKLNSRWDKNKSFIIYGHNMASGQMFAGLNKLMGNLNNARAAATFTLSTLFRQNEYKVFAVILTDEAETSSKWYFNTRRTAFESDEDFLDYIEEMRARSMFDYPVDVRADDEIVVLSTCTNKNSAKVKNGRLVVVARRCRAAEASVNTSKIVKNEDVIMPRNWYVNQQLPLHAFYENDYAGTVSTTGTTGTTTTEHFADDTTTLGTLSTTDQPNTNTTNISIQTTTTTVPTLTTTRRTASTEKTTAASTSRTAGDTDTTTTVPTLTTTTTKQSITETTTTSRVEVSQPDDSSYIDTSEIVDTSGDGSQADSSYIDTSGTNDTSDIDESSTPDESDIGDASGDVDDSSVPDVSYF